MTTTGSFFIPANGARTGKAALEPLPWYIRGPPNRLAAFPGAFPLPDQGAVVFPREPAFFQDAPRDRQLSQGKGDPGLKSYVNQDLLSPARAVKMALFGPGGLDTGFTKD